MKRYMTIVALLVVCSSAFGEGRKQKPLEDQVSEAFELALRYVRPSYSLTYSNCLYVTPIEELRQQAGRMAQRDADIERIRAIYKAWKAQQAKRTKKGKLDENSPDQSK